MHQLAPGAHPRLTTNQGAPVSDHQNPLRPYPRDPILLEDFVLRGKLTHFDHGRIPERACEFVKHAFGHLKAMALDDGGCRLLQRAGVEPDQAVVDASNVAAFTGLAKTRQWEREPKVRMPA